MPVKYFIIIDGTRRGPFSNEELDGQGLRRDTMVWFKGQPDWLPAGRVPELLDVFEEPPPMPGQESAPGPGEERPAPPAHDGAFASEPIKAPVVSMSRTELPPSDYRDDADQRPRSIARVRIPYDVVGLRRLYLGGMLLYVPGLVLILAVGAAIAYLAAYGAHHRMSPRFDPQRKMIVFDHEPGFETLAIVGTFAAAALGLICLAIGTVCFCVLLYRAWAVIQDGRTRPPPGRAVGFLFLPFFNVYWVFIGVWGLTRALNRFVRRYDLDAPNASQPLGFTISLYSTLTYLPIPFAGLVPLGLNLVLLPFFMRSVYATVAAICDDANRDRLTHAPLDRTVRWSNLPRPMSAHILSIVGAVLALISVGLTVGGLIATLTGLGHYNRDARMDVAQRQAINHLRGLGALNQQDQNQLRDFEIGVNNRERHWNSHGREQLIISTVVLGVGILLLTVALVLAFLSRVCARTGEEAGLQAPPAWPVAHGAGFLSKNARNP